VSLTGTDAVAFGHFILRFASGANLGALDRFASSKCPKGTYNLSSNRAFYSTLGQQYKVIWRAVSVDTHVAAGNFTFALL
jgi:hypothetical protein